MELWKNGIMEFERFLCTVHVFGNNSGRNFDAKKLKSSVTVAKIVELWKSGIVKLWN
jgi:hypothetical protein